MARLLLGPTLPGRYPRWGYLDRLETNAAMPRACGAALAGLGALALVVSVFQALLPAPLRRSLRARPLHLDPVHILPVPLPPPLLRPRAPMPRPVVPQPARGAIVPVDAEIGSDLAPAGNATGGAPGAATDTAPWDEGFDDGAIGIDPVTPEAESFVAVEHEPELVFMQPPQYPEIARDAGIEGTVLLRVLVGADGAVRQAVVLRGVTGLDEAALAAVATAVFRPARQQWLPVAVWVVFPIQFSLRPSP